MTPLPRQLAVLDRLASPTEESQHLHALIQAQGLAVTPADVEAAVAQVDLAKQPALTWSARPTRGEDRTARRQALADQIQRLERSLPEDPTEFPGFIQGAGLVAVASTLLIPLARLWLDEAMIAEGTRWLALPLMLGMGAWREWSLRRRYREAAPRREQLKALHAERRQLAIAQPDAATLARWSGYPLAVAQVRAWNASPVGLLQGDVDRLEQALRPPSATDPSALTALFSPAAV